MTVLLEGFGFSAGIDARRAILIINDWYTRAYVPVFRVTSAEPAALSGLAQATSIDL